METEPTGDSTLAFSTLTSWHTKAGRTGTTAWTLPILCPPPCNVCSLSMITANGIPSRSVYGPSKKKGSRSVMVLVVTSAAGVASTGSKKSRILSPPAGRPAAGLHPILHVTPEVTPYIHSRKPHFRTRHLHSHPNKYALYLTFSPAPSILRGEALLITNTLSGCNSIISTFYMGY